MFLISIQRFNGNSKLTGKVAGKSGVKRLVSAGTYWIRSLHNLVDPAKRGLNMTPESLNLREKQMEHYKYTNLHCIHLGDRLGLKRLGRTSQITFDSNKLTHDRGFHQSRMLTNEGHLFSSVPITAPLCYVLMDSVGNPCGTDYTVEGSRFDRLQISTTARLQQLLK